MGRLVLTTSAEDDSVLPLTCFGDVDSNILDSTIRGSSWSVAKDGVFELDDIPVEEREKGCMTV